MLADREMRSVLLGARGRKEDRRVPCGDRGLDLDGGQLLQEDAWRRLLGVGTECDEQCGTDRSDPSHDLILPRPVSSGVRFPDSLYTWMYLECMQMEP